ncbi:hypothetical protein Emtol_3359 [Emticicia oligotrophica DSM 17448]|uniref:DUF3575 domain-containing protein n=1 Tax=Emticicia oligotrophica (strain DSM 17448 / CIP 109782 / MTCC 6937 / GPTSA100-15) TaxID=929562 RepID=A0ABN4AQL4_EMTOG|nr:DUF3575 domain-containing protein [Emticicia oligotrophica]AFK04488.1 hypothetical protein Emtol_3359 [Emticicia oligotrophica DSM 17448]
MKKSFGILFFIFITIQSFAQEERREILKVNLSAAAMQTATIQYEKVFGRHFSLAIGGGFRPKKLFPYAKDLEKYVDFADNKIDYISFANVRKTESKIGMYHLTPEMRFYFGNKGAPIGTYLSVFGKYNHFYGDVPVFIDTEYRGVPVRLELPVDTKLQTTSLGLMIGRQFRIGERFTFDWYVIGGHFGRVKVHGESNQNLEGFDDDFRKNLRNKIIETFKINEDYLGLVVDNQGVRIDNVRQLNYLNLRGFGFNLGYRF